MLFVVGIWQPGVGLYSSWPSHSDKLAITFTSEQLVCRSFGSASFIYKALKMLSLCKGDVPEYLRCGAFYSTLAGDDEEPFQFPVEVSKLDLHLRNDDDLRHVLTTLRFWAVDTPPVVVVEYCYGMFAPELSELTKEYGRALPYLESLTEIRRHKLPHTRFNQALRSGNLHIIQYAVRLAEAAGTLVWEDSHFGFVLKAGNVVCLRLRRRQRLPRPRKC
jgi:hypothetical protein